MIHQNNIVAFIDYLYQLRYQKNAPNELLQKWGSIHQDDILIKLNQLFESWNYTKAEKEKVISDFLNKQNSVKQTQIISNDEQKAKVKIPKFVKSIVLLLILSLCAFLGYKYVHFKNLHYIYTLTERVAIRNEEGLQIGTFDLTKNTRQGSFQRLLAYDENIYSRTIDSTANLYDHRKVVMSNASFWDFLVNKQDIFAYVNAKYVVDSEEEFKTYLRLFGQLNAEDNKRLQLKHRKVIANCISFNKSMKNLYVVSSCVGASSAIRKNNLSLIVHEIIKDNKYECIAKLSDGYYYQFIGDVLSDIYMEPRKMGFTEYPSSEDEFVTGDFLFRYNPNNKNFFLTNCQGKKLPYETISNADGSTSYFKKIVQVPAEENPLQPIQEIGEDAVDAYESVKEVLKSIFK